MTPSRAPSPSAIGQFTLAGSTTGGTGLAVGLRVAGRGAGFLVVAGGFVV
jgi:hypothetical protein